MQNFLPSPTPKPSIFGSEFYWLSFLVRGLLLQLDSFSCIGALLEFACVTYVGDKDAAKRKKLAAATQAKANDLVEKKTPVQEPPPTEVKRRMPNLDDETVSLRVKNIHSHTAGSE